MNLISGHHYSKFDDDAVTDAKSLPAIPAYNTEFYDVYPVELLTIT